MSISSTGHSLNPESFLNLGACDTNKAREILTHLNKNDDYRRIAFEDLDRSYQSLKTLGRSVYASRDVAPELLGEYKKTVRFFNAIASSSPDHHIVEDGYEIDDGAVVDRARTSDEINELLRHKEAHVVAHEYLKRGDLAQALYIFEKKGLRTEDFPYLDIFNREKVLPWINQNLAFRLKGMVSATEALEGRSITESRTTAELDYMALSNNGLGMGYKSANLIRLQDRAERAREATGCDVRVPDFLPIGDLEMQTFVRKHFPEIDECWDDFMASFDEAELEAFRSSQEPMKLSPAGKAALEAIQAGIGRVFGEPGYVSPQMTEWFTLHPREFVIVRSTGKEDSETNSNAGGNASIPFISCNPKAVSHAMGDVLLSYFSEKSVLQRISAGDVSLVDESFFMPVLVQEMVGEHLSGEGTDSASLPRSGVMFTCSPEMGPGLTKLYVGLGNNEGIVSSRVATDAVFIDAGRHVQTVSQDKATRFVAVRKDSGAIGCEPIENRGELASTRTRPALDDRMAGHCKALADFFSADYGTPGQPKPLDMEFSIIGNTIHLLQARPLMQPVPDRRPDYLADEVVKRCEERTVVRGDTLVPGHSYVRHIENNNQWLVCDTITQALDIYLHDKANQPGIKTVVVYQPAPGTSHEAVTFRSKGVSVIIVKDKAEFDKLAAIRRGRLDGNLFADPQNGQLVHLPASANTTGLIKEGYYCYPMPLGYSMKPTQLTKTLYELQHVDATTPDERKELLKHRATRFLTSLHEDVVAFRAACRADPAATPHSTTSLETEGAAVDEGASAATASDVSTLTEGDFASTSTGRLSTADDMRSLKDMKVKELIHEIAHGCDEARCKEALAMIITRLHVTCKKKSDDPLTKHTAVEMLLVLENALAIAKNQLLPALNSTEPGSLERLYPVRLLESCLFQKDPSVQGGFSFASAGSLQRNETKAIDMFRAIGITADHRTLDNTPLLKVSQTILKQALRSQWNDFLRQVMADDFPAADRRELLDSIQRIDEQGLLLEWCNTELPKFFTSSFSYFDEDIRDTVSYNIACTKEEICVKIRENIRSMDAAFTHADRARMSFSVLRQGMAHWGEPGHAVKEQRRLTEVFKSIGFADGPTGMIQLYTACTTDGAKLCYLNTWREALRVYDELIKAVKGSDLPSTERARAVKTMLGTYRDMCRQVLKLSEENHITMMSDMSMDYGGIVNGMISQRLLQPEVQRTMIREVIPQLAGKPVGDLTIGQVFSRKASTRPGSCEIEVNTKRLRDFGLTPEECQLFKLHTGILDLDTYLNFMDHGGFYQVAGEILHTPGFEHIEIGEDSDFAEVCLEPSAGFNVGASILGNTTDYDQATVWPSTLEDYFTTFHQNMERSINQLRKQCRFDTSILPDEISTTLGMVSRVSGDDGGVELDQMSVEGKTIEFSYNIRLRQHAAKLKISVDTSTTPNSYKFVVNFLGGEEHGRWALTAASSLMIGSDIPQIRMSTTPSIKTGETPRGVGIAFELNPSAGAPPPDTQFLAAITFIKEMCAFSSDDMDPRAYIDAATNLRKTFNPDDTMRPLTREQMEAGGLFAAPRLITLLLEGSPEQKTQGARMLGDLKAIFKEKPQWLNLEIEGKFDLLGQRTLGNSTPIMRFSELAMLRA